MNSLNIGEVRETISDLVGVEHPSLCLLSQYRNRWVTVVCLLHWFMEEKQKAFLDRGVHPNQA